MKPIAFPFTYSPDLRKKRRRLEPGHLSSVIVTCFQKCQGIIV